MLIWGKCLDGKGPMSISDRRAIFTFSKNAPAGDKAPIVQVTGLRVKSFLLKFKLGDRVLI
jgi:hypothetical protein